MHKTLRTASVFAVLTLICAMSACALSTPAEFRKHIVSADELALDGAVAAFVMGRLAVAGHDVVVTNRG